MCLVIINFVLMQMNDFGGGGRGQKFDKISIPSSANNNVSTPYNIIMDFKKVHNYKKEFRASQGVGEEEPPQSVMSSTNMYRIGGN